MTRPGCCGTQAHPTTSTSAVAEMTRPAPSSPDRLPVAAVTATASCRRRAVPPRWPPCGRGARHQAGTIAPDAQVHALDTQSRRGETLDHLVHQVTAVDAPGPRVVRREEPPQVTHARRTQERIAQRVEHHVTVGVAVQTGRLRDPQSAQAEAVVGAEGMAVEAPAVASRDALREHRGKAQVGRVCDLERRRLALHGGHGDALTRQQLRLVPEHLGPVGPRLHRRQEKVPVGALGRLGTRDTVPVDDAGDDPVDDTLERVGHQQHGDRRAVAGRSRCDTVGQGGRGQRPRRVVDQDHLAVGGAHACRHRVLATSAALDDGHVRGEHGRARTASRRSAP